MSRLLARTLVGIAVIVVVTALQATVFSRLPLPGGNPSLPLVIVVAAALAGGVPVGATLGFGTGLLADALSDHPLGVLALVFLLVGIVVGSLDAPTERSVFWSMIVVAVTTVGASLGYLVLLALVGSGVGWGDALRDLPASVGYNVILTPLVFPLALLLIRALQAPAERVGIARPGAAGGLSRRRAGAGRRTGAVNRGL